MCHISKSSIGGIEVSIGAWSPNETQQYGILNWSLRSIQKQQDANRDFRFEDALYRAFRKIGARDVFAPNVVLSSAQITESAQLERRIKLGRGIVLFRNQKIPADGVFLRPGESFAMSGAGCPLIIAAAGEFMIVAHAGRDSLVDRGTVAGMPTRQNVSVVHSIVEEFGKKRISPDEISMRMQFAIPGAVFEHRFDHPSYGDYNRALWKFIISEWPSSLERRNGSMFLDLEGLFENQARQLGVRDVQAENSLAELPSLAHTRDGKKNPVGPDGREVERRNLIVVKRTS